jgi:hypothetical protein
LRRICTQQTAPLRRLWAGPTYLPMLPQMMGWK